MVFAAGLFASFLLLAAAKPMDRRSMSVHESRAAPAHGFVKSGEAPASEELTLRIGLKNTDIAGLETALYAVSDPASALYGQHLTPEEVAAFVKPTEEGLAAVTAWLSENNIPSKPVTPSGDMLEITIPVSQANELLSTDFAEFTHIDSGTTSIRTLEYSVPASLKSHIEFFHPTTSFERPLDTIPKFAAVRPKPDATVVADATPVADAVPASCATVITPACLQSIYNIPTTPATQSSNKLGVAGYISQFANLLDLQQFLTSLRTDISSSTSFTLQSVDGGVNTQTPRSGAGVEANLDIQYTVGLATGVPVQFISSGSGTSTGFLDVITTLINESAATRPHVLSTSYGFNEGDLSRAVANNLCNAFMQLGALGTSVLFSSGDGGVAGSQTQTCTNFIPTLPSDCPFVTSIGSTGGIHEVGSSFSSGGFSNYFAAPSYQTADVATFLAGLGSTYAGKFNRTGRAFPDVAAQGENYEIAWNAQFGLVDGTSASTPTFASIIALLNDQLVAAGKAPLGFLNPFLYSATGRAALNDIKSGNNPGCNTNGFSAGPGWDAVTGLGTPNFALLKTAVGL
ncbi:family S53 protease-like protein [Mycena crocata]|nr:family S53 protease-like protein [Mycena crocata]